MMSRLEKRYLYTEDIISWCHGEYTRDMLEEMNISDLFELHNQIYFNRLNEVNLICK